MTGHVMNIMLAVMILLVLVYLGVRLVQVYYNTDVRRAEGTLKIIDEKIAYFNGGSYTGEELKFLVFPPDGNKWFLVSLKRNFFPEKQCLDQNYENCLCLCQNIGCKEVSLLSADSSYASYSCTYTTCEGTKACKGFNGIVIDGFHDSRSTSSTQPDTIEWIQGERTEYHTNYIRYLETLPIEGAEYELKLTKSDGKTKIGAVK